MEGSRVQQESAQAVGKGARAGTIPSRVHRGGVRTSVSTGRDVQDRGHK